MASIKKKQTIESIEKEIKLRLGKMQELREEVIELKKIRECLVETTAKAKEG